MNENNSAAALIESAPAHLGFECLRKEVEAVVS